MLPFIVPLSGLGAFLFTILVELVRPIVWSIMENGHLVKSDTNMHQIYT